jgi:class 3 adenylate cyclase/tetratricopeptide (TPR) repeat protein
VSTVPTIEASPAAVHEQPEAYLPGDRRRALAAGRELPDRVRGAAIFADISGFTRLTEELASQHGPRRGAEELTGHLNRVFHAVIGELGRFGGDVIYFSGDAVTCWIDGDDGARAVAAGLAMQGALDRVGEIVTPSGASIRLAMKVAVAVGPARRFLVGDPEIQLIEVLAGRLIDDLAQAEEHAERGEVVVDPAARASLGHRVEIAAEREVEAAGRTIAVVGRLAVEVEEVPPPAEADVLDDEQVRPWILPAVYERLRAGRGELLAELRPAFPLFVRFGGIDYDGDEAAIAKLDAFVSGAQRILRGFGGAVLQLTLGDKGAYLYGVFGSPIAHEDDAARAAAAALALLDLEGATAVTGIQVGIAHGQLRSGTYGHPMRRTFVCLGDAVNLAARLMSMAPAGRVFASEPVRSAAGAAFSWEPLGPLSVKGKSEPVIVFSLAGARGGRTRRTRYRLPIFGRGAEIAALRARLDEAAAGAGRIVAITAEAGMGKSRLVAELVRDARRRGVMVAYGECQSFGANISYFPWRDVWRRLLHVREDVPTEERVRALERELAAIDPALVARAPLLGVVLDIPIPDNELTGPFDAKVRKASLESLLVACLQARAVRHPLVIVLEDCHWLDPLSRDLLVALARAGGPLHLLIVVASRPVTSPGAGLGIERLPGFSELALTELDGADAALLIRAKLEQQFGGNVDPAGSLVDLVAARSQGNPFYVEELLTYIKGQGIDPTDTAALGALELPDSLQSLILSRIDALAESPRRTLKVASVIGRLFHAPWLPAVHPELGDLPEVRDHLVRLREAELVLLDIEADDSYLFKHVVTQEVAYESLPFGIRATLHGRVGRYLEESEPDAIDRNLDLLAHHYWHGDDAAKKREYLVRAGRAAQANYANAAAVRYFERAAPLLEGADRWEVTRRLGEALEVAGDWPRAGLAYRDALALADGMDDASAAAWTDVALADLARKRGDYDEASSWLTAARERFEELGDRVGLGRVTQVQGTVAATRGDFVKARELLEMSLEIRRELGDKAAMGALLSNLGIMAEYDGDYDRSWALHDEGLGLRVEAGDKGAIAISLMNLGNVLLLQGNVEEARLCQEESLRLRRETGDPWMIALGEHNLGLLTRSQGDYRATRDLFARALRTFRDQGDRWALAFILEDVAVLATLLEAHEAALRLAGAGSSVRDEIGAPRGPADQAELDGQLDASRRALGVGASAAWQDGRALGLDAAIEETLAFL